MEPFPFIVGCARSGTTLLRHMFDSHSRMAVPYESRVAWGMTKNPGRYEREPFAIDRFVADLFARWGFDRWGMDERHVRDALAAANVATAADAVRLVYRTYAGGLGKDRYGEKTPSNALLIGDLAVVFPESCFVHIVRDGRDVALSMKDTEWWGRTLTEAVITWRSTVEGARKQGAPLGAKRYQEVRYEDLVRSPEESLRNLCTMIGLEFEPSMLRYHERADEIVKDQIRPHEFANLKKPPTEGVRDWRKAMSAAEIEVADAAAGGLLAEFGYERGAEAGLRARSTVAAARARIRSREAYSELRRGIRRLTGRTKGAAGAR